MSSTTRATPDRGTGDSTTRDAPSAATAATTPAATTTTGSAGTTPTAATAGRSGGRTARAPGRTRVVLVGLAILAAGGAAVGAVLADGGDAPATSSLPATLAGLPAQPPGPAGGPADQLTARLRAEPSVVDVAVRVYGADERVMVVLDLTPRTALTDTAAGELTARVLGAADPGRGVSDDVRSAVTEDGLALVTCSTPEPGTSTCVSVEPDRALVVVSSGGTADPVEQATAVRDEVAGTA